MAGNVLFRAGDRQIPRGRRPRSLPRSPRSAELAILVATAEGSSRQKVIDERDIALATFKRHVANLLGKTKDQTLMHAAARLLREVGRVGAK